MSVSKSHVYIYNKITPVIWGRGVSHSINIVKTKANITSDNLLFLLVIPITINYRKYIGQYY